ncbi:L,D-transpeptidase family protein [Aerococcaceae bacterium 50-4]
MKKVSMWVLGAILAVLIVGYGVGVYYYQSHFLPATTISSVNVSGMTKADAEAAVAKANSERTMTITDQGQEITTMNLQEAGFKPAENEAFDDILKQQSTFTWPVDFVSNALKSIEANESNDWTVDQESFNTYFDKLNIDQEGSKPSTNAQVVINDETKAVEVVPETQGDQVTSESMADAILSEVKLGTDTLDITDAYVKPSVTSDSEEIQKAKAELEGILSAKIGMQIEDEVVNIPSEKLAAWVSTDDQGKVQVDEAAIDQYLYEWNVENAGLNQDHKFQSTASGEVTVTSGIYGWYIEREMTTELVAEAVLAGEDTVIEPNIWGGGYNQDNFFGSSYIEVDLSKQKMFVYIDGEQKIATDIVSGNTGTDTVPGAYEIWNMENPSVLKGYNPRTQRDYAQPVDYWMAFDFTGQGIHDANWQSSFGGDAYQQNGSLGCINTPPKTMAEVYDLAYVGLPVIVF